MKTNELMNYLKYKLFVINYMNSQVIRKNYYCYFIIEIIYVNYIYYYLVGHFLNGLVVNVFYVIIKMGFQTFSYY